MEFELTVPTWYLRNQCGQGPTPRLEARPQLPTPERHVGMTVCGVCLTATEAGNRTITNYMGRRRVLHIECFRRVNPSKGIHIDFTDPAYMGMTNEERASVVINATGASKPYTGNAQQVCRGNLGDSIYKYWVGAPVTNADFAMCRACRMIVDTPAKILFHKEQRDRQTKLPCMYLLTATYKILKSRGMCLMCGVRTFGERYGIPICGAFCEYKWKFGQQVNAAVASQLFEVRKKLVEGASCNL